MYRRLHWRRNSAAREVRRGAIFVELAIVLPIFLLMFIGIIEFGRAVMVQQIVTNAALEGARRAIVPGATQAQVQTLVENYLANTSIDPADCTITIQSGSGGSIDRMNSHDPLFVQITVPYNSVSFGLGSWLGGTTLGATVEMRRE